MQSTLVWLNLFAIQVGFPVIAERPACAHIRVGVLQPLKILTANPAGLIVEHPVNRHFEQSGRVIYIVAVVVLKFAVFH